MCASVGSSLIIIIIRSICMELFMDHKNASESKHVNRYDDMVGSCCSREPCDTYAITLGKTPSSPIAPAERNLWRRHCSRGRCNPGRTEKCTAKPFLWLSYS